ncbi:hypothetical protein QE372_005139 [Agrobacterium pusense]|uniref:hypothetical protein n=1 Tax=Agrobacterium pusense TaxID=648995 RepID=UPI00286756D6|nr:hypothetical protein [Agrobacterium pusense]MDR6192805.1 hypothetical protein [Agrobacterium pusense]
MMMVIGPATADFARRLAVNNTDGGGTKKSESIRPRHPGIRAESRAKAVAFDAAGFDK